MCFWSRKRAIAVKLTSNTAKTIDNARIALRIFSTNQAVFSLMKEFLTSDEFQSPDLRTILSAIIKHNSLTREESSWNTRLFQNATAALRTDRTLQVSCTIQKSTNHDTFILWAWLHAWLMLSEPKLQVESSLLSTHSVSDSKVFDYLAVFVEWGESLYQGNSS